MSPTADRESVSPSVKHSSAGRQDLLSAGELWIVMVCSGCIRVMQKCGRGRKQVSEMTQRVSESTSDEHMFTHTHTNGNQHSCLQAVSYFQIR